MQKVQPPGWITGLWGSSSKEIDLAKRAGLSSGDVKAAVASGLFDESFYLRTYPDIAEAGVNPFEHYLMFGRFEKRRPCATFDPCAYLEANPEVVTQGVEPFLHYVSIGRAAGASRFPPDYLGSGLSSADLETIVASGIFDEHFYLVTYPDIAEGGGNPFEHYLLHGRSEGRKPSAEFDPRAYLEANPEVAAQGFDPLVHYVSVGRAAGVPLSPAEIIPPRPELTRELAAGTERLIIFLTPAAEHLRTGGILSIDAIYRESAALTAVHGAKVALCAVPGDDPLLVKYGWFADASYLLDLTAVLRSCADLQHLQLHIPEGGVNRVARWLDAVRFSLLRNVKEIHLNIMIANIDLIQGQNIAELKRFGKVTATAAHAAYSTSEMRQRLGVSLHRLGVCNGPELYMPSSYGEKESILVVSHDEHPLKEQVLGQIARALPRLEIHIVRNLSYEEYRKLILRAKWSLTFGEGLDGYFNEVAFSGGIPFAVFNERFFTPGFAQLETVYPSWEILTERIVRDLQRLDEPIAYERCWRQAYDLLSPLFSTSQFRRNLRAFYRGDYTFP